MPLEGEVLRPDNISDDGRGGLEVPERMYENEVRRSMVEVKVASLRDYEPKGEK